MIDLERTVEYPPSFKLTPYKSRYRVGDEVERRINEVISAEDVSFRCRSPLERALEVVGTLIRKHPLIVSSVLVAPLWIDGIVMLRERVGTSFALAGITASAYILWKSLGGPKVNLEK